MQDQGLAAVGLLPPLKQKERREGVLSRTQQGSPIEKATLGGATAFYRGTTSLLQPSRKEARRENTPSFTLRPSMPCWSYPLAEPARGQENHGRSALQLLGHRDPKGRRDNFQPREMSHLYLPMDCSQVLLKTIVHWRPRRPWEPAWVWRQPELGLDPGSAICRLPDLGETTHPR